jgi:3-oxoacyl-[acyl-carrier protein] reductase
MSVLELAPDISVPPVDAVLPDLRDKVVLITGASTGIGAAAARAFGRNGARVVVNYRASDEEARLVAADIETAGGRVLVAKADVTQPAAAQRIVDQTLDAFGRLDVLINNAGALIRRTPVAEYTEEFIDTMLELNVKQVIRLVQAGVAAMRPHGGAIVNVSSIAARNGGGPGSVLYAASKGFIAVATRGWARELAKDRIRVNAVSPGVILTPFHERFSTKEQLEGLQASIPMGRVGLAEECVGAFLYLASERMSGYVTGQILEVNGGQVMP